MYCKLHIMLWIKKFSHLRSTRYKYQYLLTTQAIIFHLSPSVRIDVEYLSWIPILATFRKGSPSLMHSLLETELVKHDYQVVSKY